MSLSTCDAVIQDIVNRIFAASEGELAEGIRERLNKEGFDADDLDLWLGRYRPMSSPGTIELHWRRLGRLFFETAGKLDVDCRNEQARRLCQVLVAKTYGHEQFHFLSDVFSHVTGRRGDRDTEEALATAWGWIYCQAVARHIGLDPALTEKAVRFWFDDITAAGYCRWKEFAHRCFFEDEMATHLGLAAMAASGDGRDLVPGIFLSGAGVAGLCRYQVVEGNGAGDPVSSWAGKASAFPAEIMAQALSWAPGYVPAKRLDLSAGKLAAAGMSFEAGEYEEVLLCHNPIPSLADGAVSKVLEKISANRLCLRHCGLTKGLLELAKYKERHPTPEPDKRETVVLDNFPARILFNRYLAGECDIFELQENLKDAEDLASAKTGGI